MMTISRAMAASIIVLLLANVVVGTLTLIQVLPTDGGGWRRQTTERLDRLLRAVEAGGGDTRPWRGS